MRRGLRNDIAVIDTNVVRILSSQERNPQRRDYYRSRLANLRLRVSFMTVHEVLWGIQNKKLGPERTAEVLADLRQYQIVYPSTAFISASVQLRIRLQHQQLSLQDLFIASSALALRCPFVTDDKTMALSLMDAGITSIISRHLHPDQQG